MSEQVEPLSDDVLAVLAVHDPSEVDWRAEYARLHLAYRALMEAHRGVLASLPAKAVPRPLPPSTEPIASC